MTLKLKMNMNLIKPEIFKKALIESALDVQRDAKNIITNNKNVDTGRLRGSISYATKEEKSQLDSPALGSDMVDIPENEMVVNIGTNVEYAIDIEYGTENNRGKGGVWSFLRRALIGQKKNIENKFIKYLNLAMRGKE
jgi:hypothetical protein